MGEDELAGEAPIQKVLDKPDAGTGVGPDPPRISVQSEIEAAPKKSGEVCHIRGVVAGADDHADGIRSRLLQHECLLIAHPARRKAVGEHGGPGGCHRARRR